MITEIGESKNGIFKYSISSEEELKEIDLTKIAPTSTAILVDDNGMRMFMLNGDKTKWVEI